MCGLTGFLTAASSADPTAIISAMTSRLIHRGPDDGGIWLHQDDGIALGHRRLAIIDLSSSGHQPMHSHDGRYVIAYNGEIYNFLALKKQLKHHHFLGHSDTEVILALITEHGFESTLNLLSGMFALAVWDKKEKTLYLARDRVGEKPLYYGTVNDAFVFGSELKALCRYPGFQPSIDRSNLALFFQYGYIPAPHSIYKGIYKLMPGTYLSITKSTIEPLKKPTTYWSATHAAEKGLANPLKLTDKDAIQQTDTMLKTIVRGRMISDVPVGALLSGGIDSSLITALMQVDNDKPIRTFTLGFDTSTYNEAPYAKAIASHLKTEHTEFYLDAHQALSIIPRLPEIYDEPFADASAIPTFLLSQLTKQQVSVCLSGDGGDELFGGYNRYLMGQALWKKMALMPYPIRLMIRRLLLSISPTQWHQLLRFTQIPMVGDKVHKFAIAAGSKSPDLLYQSLISQWHDPHQLIRYDTESPSSTSILLHQLEGMDFIEKMMITDTLTYLPDDILVKVDRASMAVGLENRAPYLDHQLIEWIWTLPMHMKIRNRSTKWLLRQILSKHLPPHLFERPKMGFSVPLDAWLRGPLREWADNLLDKKRIEQQGFLRAEPILEKWQEHLSGKRNWQYLLWTVLMFQAWVER